MIEEEHGFLDFGVLQGCSIPPYGFPIQMRVEELGFPRTCYFGNPSGVDVPVHHSAVWRDDSLFKELFDLVHRLLQVEGTLDDCYWDAVSLVDIWEVLPERKGHPIS